MDFKRLTQANLDGKTVLVRVDFNVPRDKSGAITDDTRIRSALPTIQYAQDKGAKIILLSHFGRPKGEADPDLSLRFIVPALSQALNHPVQFSDNLEPDLAKTVKAADILLLENTRFHAGETQGDKALAERFAALGDIFIMDAFSAAHRNHASSAGIAQFLPAYAGLAMARELDHIGQALNTPQQPVMGVVGGAKVSTKIDLLKNLVTRLDYLVIGGGMANTFLYALGDQIGSSLCEKDFRDTALDIMAKAKQANCDIILPSDLIVATDFAAHAPHRTAQRGDVKPNEMILDAGMQSVQRIISAMNASKTLIWNGPLGAFELSPFDKGTVTAAKAAALLTRSGSLISVAGGGDTVAALNHAGAGDDFTFISTAGGAFLEWMEGKALPGVDILKL